MKPRSIGLSIDFDFFCREDEGWEFGHSENGSEFKDIAWTARYLHLDLVKECNPNVYADFLPEELLEKLEDRGLIIPPDCPLGIADSHLAAHSWFKSEKLDMIVHIDAHHDAWPIPKTGIDCGSWLTDFLIPTIAVYPKWKDPNIDPTPAREGVDIIRWSHFKMTQPNMVVKAFLCRSSAWVPPHLDVMFGDLVSVLSERMSPISLECIKPRPELDLKRIAKFRKDSQIWLKEVQEKMSKEASDSREPKK